MIGSYQDTSGAEQALVRTVEAMAAPDGVDMRLDYPVFDSSRRQSPGGDRPLMAYNRRDTKYEISQGARLLEVDLMPFDIYIMSPNENLVLSVMGALESGFNAFPMRSAFEVMQPFLRNLTGIAAVSMTITGLLDEIEDILPGGDIDVSAQIAAAKSVNAWLASITAIAEEAGEADYGNVMSRLAAIEERIAPSPPYAFWPMGCRDLTAPEVYQLGLSGRIFSVAVEFTAAQS